MLIVEVFRNPLARPITTLAVCFTIWKTVMLAVALLSPGVGYDTCTDLLLSEEFYDGSSWITKALRPLALKLTRWDAIYFIPVAARGYKWEQEWAFGYGWTQSLSVIGHFLGASTDLPEYSTIGIIVAHLSHLWSVIALYHLVRCLVKTSESDRLPFVAACLHIVAPGGMFLSAPYSESLFSALCFTGYWAYCASGSMNLKRLHDPVRGDLLVLLSGLCFGCATTVRSNGLFNGSMFAFDVLGFVLTTKDWIASPAASRRFACFLLAGAMIAIGFVGPQVVGYYQFCVGADPETLRPWCTRMPPSIYTFVQNRYWGVGFLNYWSRRNLQWFAIGGPMLCTLFYTSYLGLTGQIMLGLEPPIIKDKVVVDKELDEQKRYIFRLTLPHALMTFVCFTISHVQIVNRIASGYPLVAIWLASVIPAGGKEATSTVKDQRIIIFLVRLMFMYNIVQGGLFASFLPPA